MGMEDGLAGSYNINIIRREKANYEVAFSLDGDLDVFISTTPKMMQAIPKITQKLSGSAKIRIPKIAVKAVPTPDHTA
ncbi:hypothetical protein ACA29_03745 [Lederbergia galactosidilytica]|uniref:Uncharacterized protein n=1 Tax=Lederbergia galactosidilytica TaxID=217031 RepID=A0A0Q9YA22_9BACI|nr:hypothetical protein ACA29_03745 [Lederbergia galactosidilytica]